MVLLALVKIKILSIHKSLQRSRANLSTSKGIGADETKYKIDAFFNVAKKYVHFTNIHRQ
jgi:hypothetical protein